MMSLIAADQDPDPEPANLQKLLASVASQPLSVDAGTQSLDRVQGLAPALPLMAKEKRRNIAVEKWLPLRVSPLLGLPLGANLISVDPGLVPEEDLLTDPHLATLQMILMLVDILATRRRLQQLAWPLLPLLQR